MTPRGVQRKWGAEGGTCNTPDLVEASGRNRVTVASSARTTPRAFPQASSSSSLAPALGPSQPYVCTSLLRSASKEEGFWAPSSEMQHRLTFGTLTPREIREWKRKGATQAGSGMGSGGLGGGGRVSQDGGSSTGTEASCLERWVPSTRSSKSQIQMRHCL